MEEKKEEEKKEPGKKTRMVVVEEISESQPAVETETKTKEVETKTEPVEKTPEIEKPEPVEVIPAPSPSSFNILWIIIPGLLILGVLVGGIIAYQSGLQRLNTQEIQIPEPTPVPTLTPSPTPEAKLDLSKYPITILNGSGIKGEASKAQDLLEKAGMTVASAGNAKTYDYQKTQISLKTGIDPEFVKAVTTALSKTYQLADPKTVSSQTEPVIVTIGSLKSSNEIN